MLVIAMLWLPGANFTDHPITPTYQLLLQFPHTSVIITISTHISYHTILMGGCLLYLWTPPSISLNTHKLALHNHLLVHASHH